MKIFLIAFFAVFISISLFASDKEGQSKILGTWELMDVTSVNVADSPPRGLPAIKHYYSTDGKLYGLDADEKLTEKTPSISYTFTNGVRTLKKPTGEEIQTKVDFPNKNTMRYFYDEGREVWTLKRMKQEKAYDKEIEPRSIVVLRTVDKSKQLTCFDVKYDTNDYSKLPLNERCLGVWETIGYKGHIPGTELPPYGFPNDKLIFTKDGKFSKVAPNETPSEWSKYAVTNAMITIWNVDGNGIEKFEKVRFDKWGRMVLPYKKIEITLKLLQRDTSKVPTLPGKICLLELQ